MIRDRGYSGSVVQLRRAVARLRPPAAKPSCACRRFPASRRKSTGPTSATSWWAAPSAALSCFVITLSYSRALYLEFFFDQTMENFLRGHVHAFQYWGGQPRVILYDNLRSAVLERRGNQIHFQPAAAGTVRALSLRPASLPGPRRQSERARGTRHSVCARFVLGGPHLYHAGRMQSPGAGLARPGRAPAPLARR